MFDLIIIIEVCDDQNIKKEQIINYKLETVKIEKQMNKQKILSLIKNSISLVNNFDPAISLQTQVSKYLTQSLKISVKDINLYPTVNKQAIGIRNLFQNPNLRLTVYYLSEGKAMKLHDHNQMQVVSKIISGKIQAKLYKLLDQQQHIYEKTVTVYDSNGVYYIDGNKSYNLHEFIALQPTYFLDIIFPDYHVENDCNFYQQKSVIGQNKVILEKVHSDDIIFEDI